MSARATARLHLQGIDAAAANSVRDSLAAASLICLAADSTAEATVEIVLFDAPAAALLERVERIAHAARRPVLALALHAASSSAADAWKLLDAGAADSFAWDHSPHPAAEIAERARRILEVDEVLRSPLVRDQLVGASSAWTECLTCAVELASFSEAPILLTGESGTGKELVARLIHTLDRREGKCDLVVLDCTTVVPELSGSEFFGHERGAFTGAAGAREGAFALADGGTLFLDEVGDLPLRLQAALLRAVQERTYKPVGGNAWRKSSFRLVSATHRDLLQEERDGRFRRDFYHRIASARCHLPRLAERGEDVLLLARHFVRAQRRGHDGRMDEGVEEFLLQREYPGNVRDLKHLVGRMLARHVGLGPLTLGDLPGDERRSRPERAPEEVDPERQLDRAVRHALELGMGLKEIGRRAEDTAVRIALEAAEGSLQLAARRLGVTDRALQLRRAQDRRAEADTDAARNGAEACPEPDAALPNASTR